MQLQTLLSFLPLVLSATALAVSAVALWKTHFARFTPVVVAGDITLRIFPIKNDAKKWFIASFACPISVTNGGATPGLIIGLRLSLCFQDLPIPDNRELISAKRELDAADLRHIDKNRFSWLDKLAVENWMPYAVLPKQTVRKLFLFETRWERPVIQSRVACRLQFQVGHESVWRDASAWDLTLDERVWSDFVENGTAMAFVSLDRSDSEDQRVPANLHDFTGSLKPLTPQKKAEPSVLDYPQSQ